MHVSEFNGSSVYSSILKTRGAGYGKAPAGGEKQASAVAGESISFSAEGRAMGKVEQEVTARGGQMGTNGLMSVPRMNSLDPNEALATADAELQRLMAEQNIPSDPPFTLAAEQGRITVSPPDHPNREALEEMANTSRELRNSLVRASNLAHLQAIGQAAYKAHQAAQNASPEEQERIYNQLFAYIDKISEYNYKFNFENGKLMGEFKDASGSPATIPEFTLD